MIGVSHDDIGNPLLTLWPSGTPEDAETLLKQLQATEVFKPRKRRHDVVWVLRTILGCKCVFPKIGGKPQNG